jgi:hypothetical protein
MAARTTRFRDRLSARTTPKARVSREPAEAASWLARVSPARHDDVMAVNDKSRS